MHRLPSLHFMFRLQVMLLHMSYNFARFTVHDVIVKQPLFFVDGQIERELESMERSEKNDGSKMNEWKSIENEMEICKLQKHQAARVQNIQY